jgi:hypothetical protein
MIKKQILIEKIKTFFLKDKYGNEKTDKKYIYIFKEFLSSFYDCKDFLLKLKDNEKNNLERCLEENKEFIDENVFEFLNNKLKTNIGNFDHISRPIECKLMITIITDYFERKSFEMFEPKKFKTELQYMLDNNLNFKTEVDMPRISEFGFFIGKIYFYIDNQKREIEYSIR